MKIFYENYLKIVKYLFFKNYLHLRDGSEGFAVKKSKIKIILNSVLGIQNWWNYVVNVSFLT